MVWLCRTNIWLYDRDTTQKDIKRLKNRLAGSPASQTKSAIYDCKNSGL
jgi:hypothetical protein